jgi:hypothetical protein
MVLLHAAHGFHGPARRFRRNRVPNEDDDGDGRQTQREPAADAETQRTPCSRGAHHAPRGSSYISRLHRFFLHET